MDEKYYEMAERIAEEQIAEGLAMVRTHLEHVAIPMDECQACRTEGPYGTGCPDYSECLKDYTKRLERTSPAHAHARPLVHIKVPS